MPIALLTAADALRYRALMLEAYTLAADAFTSMPEERAVEPEAWWLNRIAHPLGLCVAWGAFEGDALIGTVALEYSAKPKTRHKALIIGMYVREAFRGTGTAQALLAAAIAHVQARPGLRAVMLDVTAGNAPAIALYRRAGFETFGTEPMAILTPTGFKAKLHMWRTVSNEHADT